MRSSSPRISTTLFVCALVASGCSAANEDQSYLGSGPAPVASAAAGQTSSNSACPPGRPPSPAQSQAQQVRAIDQRCAQLLQDGEIWQRTRKLAIQNRGEAGARMADLHSPWTKEKVVFFVDQCGPRQHKSRQQAMSRMDPRHLVQACGPAPGRAG